MKYEINEEGLFVPESLAWRGSLDLSRTDVVTLPDNLRVDGILDLGGCTGLTALPDNLSVGGSLFLSDCTSLTALPDNLMVDGDIYLDGCTKLLPTLPDIFKVGENWYTKDFPWHIRRYRDYLEIGCSGYSVGLWMSLSDTEIGYMDRRALEFWRKYKKLLIEVGLLEGKV